MIRVSKRMRPVGRLREFTPGLDLPSWFFYNLKGIDYDFYLIFHPYRVIWDNIINQYEGSLKDPRFTIHEEYGHLNFGFVLKDKIGAPQPDNSWHLWRYCDPHGWGHIMKIEDTHGHYLKLVIKRLFLQAKYTDRYGFKSWARKLENDQETINVKQQQDRENLFSAIQEENSWLTKKAMENFASGKTAPTNPKKETIFSGAGVNYRSRLSRPLNDTEGGLVIPE